MLAAVPTLDDDAEEEEEEEEEDDDEEEEILTKESVKSWTVAELKEELVARDLPVAGRKADLVKRLQKEL